MKKTIFMFILAAIVIISTGLWFVKSSDKIGLPDLLSAVVILLVVGFAVFFGYKRVVSAKTGMPPEDEMSKKVMRHTSSISYYISLYLWLAIMYFSDKVKLETHTLIGAGILGMAIVFAICWLIFNFRGIKNE